MHRLFPQQLNYTRSDTLLQGWNHQNLLTNKWTNKSDASKKRPIGHNQHGALWSDFLRWTWLSQCLLKRSAMCGLEQVPFIYTNILSKEAWYSTSPQNWNNLHPKNSAFRSLGDTKADVLSVWPGMDHKYFLNYLLNPCDCNWWKLQKPKNWKVASNPSFPTQLGKGDGWAERNPKLFHFPALIHNNGLWGNINLSLSLEEKAARYLFATLCHL